MRQQSLPRSLLETHQHAKPSHAQRSPQAQQHPQAMAWRKLIQNCQAQALQKAEKVRTKICWQLLSATYDIGEPHNISNLHSWGSEMYIKPVVLMLITELC